MADPMRIRAVEKSGVTEVKILMRHDMETGFRKDSNGGYIPAHFIQKVIVKWLDKEVFSGFFGPAISKDPLLSFRFKGGAKGDKIQVSWVDNGGDKRSDEAAIS